MKKALYHFAILLTTIVLFVNSNSTLAASQLPSGTVEGSYKTTFRSMTLTATGNTINGTYESGNGKLTGILVGNKLTGTWTNRASRKSGKFEFVFANDFSSFSGKYGYNNNTPSSIWKGTKIETKAPTSVSTTSGKELPVNIAGSWSSGGSRNQIARVHIWQNGDEFVVISCWPDETTGKWKSYRGEGRFEGRKMNFKVFPSATDGSSIDQGYVQHWTVSPDNSEISGYYTRNGKRTTDRDVLYKLVK